MRERAHVGEERVEQPRIGRLCRRTTEMIRSSPYSVPRREHFDTPSLKTTSQPPASA
jgi:hypothetical protein